MGCIQAHHTLSCKLELAGCRADSGADWKMHHSLESALRPQTAGLVKPTCGLIVKCQYLASVLPAGHGSTMLPADHDTTVSVIPSVPHPRMHLALRLCAPLTKQVGNDFLPHIPSLDIYDNPSGLELLLTVYKQLLPDMGHLSADGAVNPQKLHTLLQRVARDEGPSFERRAVSCTPLNQAALKPKPHAPSKCLCFTPCPGRRLL